MVHRNADRVPARTLHQRRQVAVHMVEVRQVEESRALKQFDPATGVRRVVVQHARTDGIGPTRGPALAGIVLALHAPAGKELDLRRGGVARLQQESAKALADYADAVDQAGVNAAYLEAEEVRAEIGRSQPLLSVTLVR